MTQWFLAPRIWQHEVAHAIKDAVVSLERAFQVKMDKACLSATKVTEWNTGRWTPFSHHSGSLAKTQEGERATTGRMPLHGHPFPPLW